MPIYEYRFIRKRGFGGLYKGSVTQFDRTIRGNCVHF
jgi:hypothetical protein